MKICCFVICYFGKLPNYMDFFLKTCASNPEYNWLLFTDDDTPYNYPPNFQVELIDFKSFVNKVQEKFEFKICIPYPHKLCDFKPAYGHLFADYLLDYPFWGHCDLDQFFGCLNDYIPLEFLNNYEKIFTLGHMTIYKNCHKMNELFKVTYHNPTANHNSYTQVFQSPNVLAFDEWAENSVNINVLAEQEQINIYGETPMLDILGSRSYFLSSIYNLKSHKWDVQHSKHFLIYFDGKDIYSVTQKNRCLLRQKALYAHLQKRKFKISTGTSESFVIIPNRIIPQNHSKINDSKWLRKMIFIGKIRSLLYIDECRKMKNSFIYLLKHYYNKFLKCL